ncbi:MAG: S8 family serine peptidase [Dehalococcoidales bacterium]|nr:S8 family serine peptidase [Dehalococcoidales bacterium]
MISKRSGIKVLILLAVIVFASVCVVPAVPAEYEGRVADFQQTAVNGTAAQWHLAKVMADRAWKITAGSPKIVVAVLDSGIDIKQEELAGKVIASVNFSTSRTTADVYGHGTFIAGLIAASVENLETVTGVAYNCSLLNVKVADDAGFTGAEAVAKGIRWAADNGADIINLSVVLTKPSTAVEEAVKYAWSKGCLLVAAAGNNAGLKPMYPAVYQNVIAVGATDVNDRIPRWFNRGQWVTVSAPGADIYSTLPGDEYAQKSGTSFATAIVSGEAALLFAVAVDENGDGFVNDEVRDAIVNNTDAVPGAGGTGRINVLKAVETFE